MTPPTPTIVAAVALGVGAAIVATVYRRSRWRAIVSLGVLLAAVAETVAALVPGWSASPLRFVVGVVSATVGGRIALALRAPAPPFTPERPLRVLFDVAAAHWTRNPYIGELVRRVGRRVEIVGFDRRVALLGSYDVVHVHWPEHRIGSPQFGAAHRRRAWWVLWCLRLHLLGTPVVQTQHNRAPHDSLPRVNRLLLALFRTTIRGRVWLTETSLIEAGDTGRGVDVVIPHSDYGAWLRRRRVEITGRRPHDPPVSLLSVGMLKPYKNFEEGIAAVAQTDGFTLTIAGGATHADYAEKLTRLAAGVDGVRVAAERLEDSDLVRVLQAADAVLVPYEDLYNSGVIFLSLAVGRPVILRDGPMAREIRDEYGPEWVGLYPGPLTPDGLRTAWTAVEGARGVPRGSPERTSEAVGRAHARLYRRLAR